MHRFSSFLMKDLSQCSRTCTVLAILLTNAHNFTHTQHVELLLSSGFLSELCKSVRTLVYVLHCLLSPSHSPSDRYTHMQASRDTHSHVCTETQTFTALSVSVTSLHQTKNKLAALCFIWNLGFWSNTHEREKVLNLHVISNSHSRTGKYESLKSMIM